MSVFGDYSSQQNVPLVCHYTASFTHGRACVRIHARVSARAHTYTHLARERNAQRNRANMRACIMPSITEWFIYNGAEIYSMPLL